MTGQAIDKINSLQVFIELQNSDIVYMRRLGQCRRLFPVKRRTSESGSKICGLGTRKVISETTSKNQQDFFSKLIMFAAAQASPHLFTIAARNRM